MVDALAAVWMGVDNDAEAVLFDALVAGHSFCEGQHFGDQLIGGLEDSGYSILGDDEEMDGCLWGFGMDDKGMG